MFYMYHSICSICIMFYMFYMYHSICIMFYMYLFEDQDSSDVQYGSMFVTVATNAASVSAVPLPPSSHWYEVTRSVLLGAVLSN